MHHGDALERHHLQLQLDAAERELDRRAGIITILADQLARATREQTEQPMIRRWSEREGWHYVKDNKGTDRHDKREA